MTTTSGRLLWIDDEITMLKAHIIFLEKKGYEVLTVTNGIDAVEICREQPLDLVLLDENMPGLSGLETLGQIKEVQPDLPVVMVTKSEEENIMDLAIGSKIADYLIKPVNPNQILLTLKKNIHKREIVQEVTQSSYQHEFANINMRISENLNYDEWIEIYRKLVYWELELTQTDGTMSEMLSMQKDEANAAFAKFIKKNYVDWLQTPDQRPTMSPDIFKQNIFPLLSQGRKVFLLVLDNFRYDQWRMFSRELVDDFTIDESLYMSILPTVTQYARNAIFSGLMPLQIREMYPDLWVDEEEDEGKNLNEEKLIQTQLDRYRRKEKFTYNKMQTASEVDHLLTQFSRFEQTPLNVVVINFIDMMSHARTESKMVRELAGNEAAYRSITLSWLRHTPIKEFFKELAARNYDIVVTTDHGSIRVGQPTKVIGDRNLNTNLRYKLGRNMSYNAKDVFEVNDPKSIMLPSPNLSTSYIFTTGNKFFAYPNKFNYYVQYYKDTFQHGGISMEEMLVPLITLHPKHR